MQERSLLLSSNLCDTVEEVAEILQYRLSVNFTFDEIINSALESFVEKKPYVSLFSSLTGKIKFTFDDVFKLDTLTEDEEDALIALNASLHRNPDWRPLVEQIRMDVMDGIQSLHTENQVQILYENLKGELESRKRGKVYRSGYKKLIIKSAMISLIRQDNSF